MLSRKWMCWKKSGQVWSCPISRIRTLIEFCALVFVSTSHTDYTGSRPENLLSNKTKDCIRIWRLWAPPTALLSDSPTTQLVFQLHYCHSCLDFYLVHHSDKCSSIDLMPKSNRREWWLVWQLINDHDNDKHKYNDKLKYNENGSENDKYLLLFF